MNSDLNRSLGSRNFLYLINESTGFAWCANAFSSSAWSSACYHAKCGLLCLSSFIYFYVWEKVYINSSAFTV